MKNRMIILLCICLSVSVTACSQRGDTNEPVPSQESSAPSEDAAVSSQVEQSAPVTKSASEQFLEENSDEELLNIVQLANTTQIHPKNELREGFVSAADLSSDDLYNFFMNILSENEKEMERFFQADDQNYHIPTRTVTDILNQYFEGYRFDPAQVTILDTYDQQENAFVQPGVVGFGRNGPSWLEISSKETISENTVRLKVNSYDRTEDENSDKIKVCFTVQLKIMADSYQLVSNTWDYTEVSSLGAL